MFTVPIRNSNYISVSCAGMRSHYFFVRDCFFLVPSEKSSISRFLHASNLTARITDFFQSVIESTDDISFKMNAIAKRVSLEFDGSKGALELSLLYLFDFNGILESVSVRPTLFFERSEPKALRFMQLYGDPCLPPADLYRASKI